VTFTSASSAPLTIASLHITNALPGFSEITASKLIVIPPNRIILSKYQLYY
jgi:hypothetical protein